MAITPDQPWFYLIIYGSFMIFVLIFGLILAITQRNKKKKQELAAEEEIVETAE